MPVRTERETLERFSTLIEEAKKNGNDDGQARYSALNKMGIQDEAARNRLVSIYRKWKEKKEKSKNATREWWEEFKIEHAEELALIGERDAELV